MPRAFGAQQLPPYTPPHLCRHLDLSICVLKSVLSFMAPCLNVVESGYYAFKGQFSLGASVNVFLLKAGINWNFQVGGVWSEFKQQRKPAEHFASSTNMVPFLFAT